MTGHWPVVKDSDLAHPVPRLRRQRTALGGVVDTAGITGDIQAGNADPTARRGDVHQRVQHRRGRIATARAVPLGLETDASTAQSTSGTPRICSIWSEATLETSTVSHPKLRLREPFLVHVGDDDHCRAQQVLRRAAASPTGPAPAM